MSFQIKISLQLELKFEKQQQQKKELLVTYQYFSYNYHLCSPVYSYCYICIYSMLDLTTLIFVCRMWILTTVKSDTSVLVYQLQTFSQYIILIFIIPFIVLARKLTLWINKVVIPLVFLFLVYLMLCPIVSMIQIQLKEYVDVLDIEICNF